MEQITKIDSDKLLGFWREYGMIDTFSSIKEERYGPTGFPSKEITLEYLKNGIKLFGYRSVTECLHNDLIFSPFNMIFTDGAWIWSSGYIYYFEKFDLKVNKGFISHMQQKSFLPANISFDEREEIISELYILLRGFNP